MSTKGRKLSAETRAKMSASQRGRKLSAEHKAKLSAARKGKKHSAETKAKIAEKLQGREFSSESRAKMSSGQHKYWGTEPGARPSPGCWAKEVKERDNNECQYCGSKEELHAHHIFSASKWPTLAHNLNNGITLCKSCHQWHHKHNFLV